MTISQSKLFSGAYETLKEFILTNITDPRRRYKKQWIHPSEPNPTAQSFEGYPYVIITVDVREKDKSLDRTTSNKEFSILLTVESDQASEVDSISDEITSKIKSETLTNNLSEFKSLELSSASFGFRIVGGKKIHQRLIGLIGRTRL